jgi:molybdenum cofactor cytidylyltransferase
MIAGLLLAAGGARRFGSQKLVAPLDGVPLVRRAANMLAQIVDPVVVVVGSEAPAVRAALDGADAEIVENRAWHTGVSSSLKCGVAAVSRDTEAIVIAVGDQPHLDPDVVRSVISRWRETGRPIIATRYQGVQSHPVLFDRSVFGELAELSGDVGAKPLIERSADRVAYVDVAHAAPVDIDTTGDLRDLPP